ncbi:unnamed protein product, partial [Amoebophrya sp. A25]
GEAPRAASPFGGGRNCPEEVSQVNRDKVLEILRRSGSPIAPTFGVPKSTSAGSPTTSPKLATPQNVAYLASLSNNHRGPTATALVPGQGFSFTPSAREVELTTSIESRGRAPSAGVVTAAGAVSSQEIQTPSLASDKQQQASALAPSSTETTAVEVTSIPSAANQQEMKQSHQGEQVVDKNYLVGAGVASASTSPGNAAPIATLTSPTAANVVSSLISSHHPPPPTAVSTGAAKATA